MTLFCPRCGSVIPVEHADPTTLLARCRGCNKLFPFSEPPPSDSTAPQIALAAPAPLLPTPGGFHITEFAGRLTVRWRWFNITHLFLLFFCIAWDSFLVSWYATAFGRHGAPLMMKLFPIGHVAIGVFLTYATLCGFLNSTTVTAEPDALSIRHHPLPWAGNRTLPTSSIRQLHCHQRRPSRNYRRSAIEYDLYATLNDGQKLKILSGFNNSDQARFLEQRLEHHLRIPNRRVSGEFRH